MPASAAAARAVSRTALPSAVASRQASISTTSSQRPRAWKPSVSSPLGPGAAEYSMRLR